MTEIRNIGFTSRTNLQGMLINEARMDKINPSYIPALEEIVESLQSSFSKDIHSIYLRGSLPRGLAMEGISDIDLLVITQDAEDKEVHDQMKQIARETEVRYSFINGAEMGVIPLQEVYPIRRFSILPFMIKTYSVCLYGENIQPMLPEFKPDEKLANEHVFPLKSQIAQAQEDLTGNDDQEDIKDCCVWIMKIIIRCGFAFVMTKERTYTRDLYPAYHLFAKYYPSQEPWMRQALEYAIAPSTDTEKLQSFLNNFGSWMLHEAEEWLNYHNPTRLEHLPL
ncbi:nucleotidyltransferase domain-containing protein [Halobacillus sp. K22]|uniref:nucleotidyltransferase domain-containing protein n=1 Tax=Halobacillus sp. K22 TaxID=3457431 RepID=UPI003FCD6BA5